jgi:CheY-like chemotaxis protein
MDSFEVLIVDDDKSVTDLLLGQFKDRPDIHVIAASSARDAMDVVKKHFFHVAFVDMQLTKNTADGMGVFNYLRNSRPSCKAILLTAYPDVYQKELFVLFNPLFPQAHGAIDKSDYALFATTVVDKLSAAWLLGKRVVVGLPALAELVRLKAANTDVRVTDAEIDFVLSSLMGQGIEPQPDQSDAALLMNTIELSELEGGRSRSVVTAGRPKDAAGNLGIWCVIKIGPRSEVEQEYSRYCSYVRFSVALNHRVELLGERFADTTGAICYSFAGRSPFTVRSLFELFRTGEDATPYFDLMFSRGNQELYGRRGPRRDLAAYFNATYRLDPRRIHRTIEDFLDTLIDSLRQEPDLAGSEIMTRASVGRLSRAFSATIIRQPLETCIVHGDMNANNVIVAEDGRVIYIDYFHTGCGPRTVDFAALEGSLRLATCPGTIGGVLSDGEREESAWRAAWRNAPFDDSGTGPYWARTSRTLASFAKDNFSDLTAEEYAATCLLWGARLFRVTQLSQLERLRVLLWMVQCAAVIT